MIYKELITVLITNILKQKQRMMIWFNNQILGQELLNSKMNLNNMIDIIKNNYNNK